jgi:D-alanyl-D-alanine carboxypeptidase (penicillin-binding protein 5/6)
MAAEVVLSRKDPQTPVLITAADVAPEGDSGLVVGETAILGQLLRLSLVASSNDAITAAARSLGDNYVDEMNAEAANLGLTKTHFFNATGLDINTQTSGAYGSAYDVARLASIFYNHHTDFFELTTKPEVVIDNNGNELSGAATMEPLQSIHGFVAAKTGYTDLAGGNLVAIFDLEPGLTVVAAVLGSTREGRFDDIKTLINAARASL